MPEPVRPERIETPRLALVPLAAETARAVLAGDLSALRHAAGWPHDDTLDALRLAAPLWLVVLGGVAIGDCGTHGETEDDGTVEIGYGLAAEHRGHGYGSELVPALSGWLLAQPGVRRVVARDVLEDNVSSRRALVRAGFALEREERGLVSYALER